MTHAWLVLQERTIRKKLQQIEALSQRTDAGPLDGQQLAKLAMRPTLNAALEALQVSPCRTSLLTNENEQHTWRTSA